MFVASFLLSEGSIIVEEWSLVGIEARDADGEKLGRISEVVTDENSGEVTHVMVELDEETREVSISRLVLDPDADFATVSADASDEEPGDHADDEIQPGGYAPAEALPGADDTKHSGQLVSEPGSPQEAESEADVDREDWTDEESTPADSGYPRTDAYVDPETGEAVEGYPEAGDASSLEETVAALLEDTGLQAVSVSEGVVELAGSVSDGGELDRVAASVTALEEVFEVDTSGVRVG
jgi:sporulation protein YlmC with PRC-barrel domain